MTTTYISRLLKKFWGLKGREDLVSLLGLYLVLSSALTTGSMVPNNEGQESETEDGAGLKGTLGDFDRQISFWGSFAKKNWLFEIVETLPELETTRHCNFSRQCSCNRSVARGQSFWTPKFRGTPPLSTLLVFPQVRESGSGVVGSCCQRVDWVGGSSKSFLNHFFYWISSIFKGVSNRNYIVVTLIWQ